MVSKQINDMTNSIEELKKEMDALYEEYENI